MSVDAFLSGIVAGYGIAIPVGPISILILELGLHRGFRIAFSAGAGAASADLIYATVAAAAGTFLVAILAPFGSVLRVGSALALIVMGAWLLHRGRKVSGAANGSRFHAASCLQTYGMVLGLTLLNPVTVTYFTTLILGMGAESPQSLMNAILFVSGAFLASLSWQTFVAGVGGVAHRRLPDRARAVTFAIGNLVIIALGVAILLGFHI